jgi:glycine cleavage system H protein
MYPDDLRYSKDHEWVRVEGSRATIGITSFAADELGDIVFVELPAAGTAVTQFASFGVVESVKAVSDLYAPVSGEVAEVNDALREKPELVNADPFGDGWMMRVELGAPDEVEQLMDAAAYQAQTAG